MTTRSNRHVWMDQATDGAEGGAGGGSVASSAADTGGAAGASGAGAASSALASGAGAAPATGTAGAFDWIPEKHRVTKEDGTFDLEASARKVAEAHGHLEKRFGSGDLPPKSADEYAPKVGVEGFNFDEFKADPAMQTFLKGAHAKGMTNDQLSFAIEQFLEVAPSLVEGSGKLDAEQCKAALSEVWAKPEEAKANFALAYRATEAFASKIGVTFDEIEAAGLGDNPLFIRIMAAIGPELGEDTSPHTEGAGGGMSVEEFEVQAATLRQQLQELPLTDKRRPAVKAQYDALYAKRFGTSKQKLGGSASITA